MKSKLALGIGIALTTSAHAQPLPPTINDIQELNRVDLHAPPVGATVWQTPAPHELEWYIAYDATPLTVDDPEFSIRLVNDGRPIRMPESEANVDDRIGLSLTFPDGTVREILLDDLPAGFVVYSIGRDYGLISPGGPAVRFDLRLTEYFGDLEPGEHVLRITLDIGAQVQRARDAHVIAERLTTALPPLRFEVIDRPVPEKASARAHEIEIFRESDQDEMAGRIRGVLTNPLDVPLTIHADTGWNPSWSPTPEAPASMYNAIERWSDTGWLRDERVGYCGTGMGEVSIAPGESLPIALYSPRVHDRSPGVYRCVVTTSTSDGEQVEFVTPPIVVSAHP